MLPSDAERRPGEARALLVALASALRLSTAAASDFSVQVVSRALRAGLQNAHGALKEAYEGEDRDAMRKAEQSLEVRRDVGSSCASNVCRGLLC